MKASRSRIKNAEARDAKHASGPPKVSKYAAKRQGVWHPAPHGAVENTWLAQDKEDAINALAARFAKGDA